MFYDDDSDPDLFAALPEQDEDNEDSSKIILDSSRLSKLIREGDHDQLFGLLLACPPKATAVARVSLETKNHYGLTPLHLAVVKKDFAAVETLLKSVYNNNLYYNKYLIKSLICLP